MALQVKRGSFVANTITGNQAIAGVGFVPKVVLLFHAQLTAVGAAAAQDRPGFGAAISATERWALSAVRADAAATQQVSYQHSETKCIIAINNSSGTIDGEADFISQDADGFTVNWTNAPSAGLIIEYVALAGLDAKLGSFAKNTGVGNQVINGVGFQPETVMIFEDMGSGAPPATGGVALLGIGAMDADGNQGAFVTQEANAGTTDCATFQSSQAVSAQVIGPSKSRGRFGSMDSDGFTIDWFDQALAQAQRLFYVALHGVEARVLTDNQKGSTGTQAKTGAGFQPKCLLGFGNQVSTGDDADVSTARDGCYVFGARDQTSEACIWGASVDNLGTSECNRAHSQTKFLSFRDPVSPFGVIAECDVASLDADGYTLDWTTADAVTRQVFVLALGDIAPVATPPPPNPMKMML